MTIGIISAIPEEYSKLNWDDTPKTETIINKVFQFGTINGVDVIAAECGIGKVNAAMTTSLLLGHYKCEGIVFSGVAGGLNPDLSYGEVIIADKLIQHDYGAIVNGRFIHSIAGSFPQLNHEEDYDFAFSMSEGMKESIRFVLGDYTRFGTVLTGDYYLSCTNTRNALYKKFRADAIEMEGAAIAQVCCNWHKPFVIVRVLSDLAGHDSHMDFDTFVDSSSEKAANVVTKLLPMMDAWV